VPTIKCTAKLAKMMGVSLIPPETDSDNDWHANVLVIDRLRYVLFCSDATRLCCLAGPVRKKDVQNLPARLMDALSATIRYEGFDEASINYCTRNLEGAKLAKTNSRSILGTMNDNEWHLKEHAFHAGGVGIIGTEALVKHVNHMPLSPLNWDYAINEYRKHAVRAI
jgi:hypothetical protein